MITVITLDSLARHLGCTLADIDDLGVLRSPRPAAATDKISGRMAARIAAAWETAK